jgi:hypothetical protein
MNMKTNCLSGGWKLLYRGETEISSTIASLSEKLQLKVAPFLLPCCLYILALKPLQGDPMPIHKPCVVDVDAVSLVFRLMPSQDCSWVACSLCGMCVMCLPFFATFILVNAARIKTFQPELPEISGKSGAFSFFFFCEAAGSSFSFRTEGKASSEISEKVAKHFEGKDRIFFASTFVETFFRIPKT